jgi:hypothetical protein
MLVRCKFRGACADKARSFEETNQNMLKKYEIMKWITFFTGLFFSTILSLYLYFGYMNTLKLFQKTSLEFDVTKFFFSNWTILFYILIGVSGALLSLKGKKISILLILIIVFYEIARRIFFVDLNVYGLLEIILAVIYFLMHFSEKFQTHFGLNNKNVCFYSGTAFVIVGSLLLYIYLRSK